MVTVGGAIEIWCIKYTNAFTCDLDRVYPDSISQKHRSAIADQTLIVRDTHLNQFTMQKL
ncbi:MAG: hypothetical protein DCF19_04680 [Pseudanabaena frigida]|uniref:Uncharacterized protein n=1 Tax=Pseudanabaena frigida TaxID=945775 RepID=A0A2W4WFH1_9CYAN|nr:MAG: hypothetical protein DCF19_04680 [Pseudanabaena frigida]